MEARAKEVIVICRAGNRSLLARRTLQPIGYTRLYSLKTGLRGWNDYVQPLVNSDGDSVVLEAADDYFTSGEARSRWVLTAKACY